MNALNAPADTCSLQWHERQKALRTRAQIAADRRWRSRDLLGHDLTIASRGTLDKLAISVAIIKNGRAKLDYIGRYALHEARQRRAGLRSDTLGRCTYQSVPLPADRPMHLQAAPQLHPVFSDMFRSMGLAA